MKESAYSVLHFWFRELTPEQWFAKDDMLDERIRLRFGFTHWAAVRGELYNWRETARGRLAEILVLDQFSRNIHRNTAKAFASDAQALALAQEAVRAGADEELEAQEKSFLYMPFMHSESELIHNLSLELFRQPGLEESLKYELAHKAIIERFGRYPHRNAVLGRVSSLEEEEFLQQPGSTF